MSQVYHILREKCRLAALFLASEVSLVALRFNFLGVALQTVHFALRRLTFRQKRSFKKHNHKSIEKYHNFNRKLKELPVDAGFLPGAQDSTTATFILLPGHTPGATSQATIPFQIP